MKVVWWSLAFLLSACLPSVLGQDNRCIIYDNGTDFSALCYTKPNPGFCYCSSESLPKGSPRCPSPTTSIICGITTGTNRATSTTRTTSTTSRNIIILGRENPEKCTSEKNGDDSFDFSKTSLIALLSVISVMLILNFIVIVLKRSKRRTRKISNGSRVSREIPRRRARLLANFTIRTPQLSLTNQTESPSPRIVSADDLTFNFDD